MEVVNPRQQTEACGRQTNDDGAISPSIILESEEGRLFPPFPTLSPTSLAKVAYRRSFHRNDSIGTPPKVGGGRVSTLNFFESTVFGIPSWKRLNLSLPSLKFTGKDGTPIRASAISLARPHQRAISSLHRLGSPSATAAPHKQLPASPRA